MSGKLWLAPDLERWGMSKLTGVPVAGGDGQPGKSDAILIWPSVQGERPYTSLYEQGAWLLNGEAPELFAASGVDMRRRLVRAGLRDGRGTAGRSGRSGSGIRRFCVSLFFPDVLRITEMTAIRFGSRTVLDAAHPLYKRMQTAALRAAYALGLDTAQAIVSADDAGRVAIEGARLPRFDTDDELKLWAAAIRRFADQYNGARNSQADSVVIGADPEFVLVRPDGRIAPANRYLPLRGEAGCDAVRIGGQVRYPLAELRPRPASRPDELLRSLRRLLGRAAAAADPALRLLAGAMPVAGLPLGGHIHLSGVPLTSRLLRALDSCAALPFAMAQDPRGQGRRPRYGALGDFRLQPHGGFEYRTLPSWLVSPAAARAALAIAALAAAEPWTLGPDLPAGSEKYVQAYYDGDRRTLAGCLDDLQARLSQTAGYDVLSGWIEPFFDAVRKGRTWDESIDIRPKWSLVPGPASRPVADQPDAVTG